MTLNQIGNNSACGRRRDVICPQLRTFYEMRSRRLLMGLAIAAALVITSPARAGGSDRRSGGEGRRADDPAAAERAAKRSSTDRRLGSGSAWWLRSPLPLDRRAPGGPRPLLPDHPRRLLLLARARVELQPKRRSRNLSPVALHEATAQAPATDDASRGSLPLPTAALCERQHLRGARTCPRRAVDQPASTATARHSTGSAVEGTASGTRALARLARSSRRLHPSPLLHPPTRDMVLSRH